MGGWVEVPWHYGEAGEGWVERWVGGWVGGWERYRGMTARQARAGWRGGS